MPVFNALPYLRAALDSICEAGRAYGPVEIIVVDNGSTDGSFELLGQRYGDVASILRLPEGRVGAVRNFGARRATGAFLSFIDSDCRVPPDYFSRAVEVVSRHKVSATGSAYVLPPDPHWIEQTWTTLHSKSGDGLARYLPAGNFFCERTAFEAAEGFDERLESGEDTEFCQRLWAAGYRIYEASEVRAVHLGNPKRVSDFFRQQLWHAVGMLGTFKHDWKDLPLLASVAHLALTLAGVVLFAIVGPSTAAFALVLVPLVLAVPTLAVAFRILTTGRRVNPVKAVFLYTIYFAARSLALAKLALGTVRSPASTVRG